MELAGSESPLLASGENYLKFDDSPEKLSYELFIDEIGPNHDLFTISKLPLELSDLSRVVAVQDSETAIISMKKPGQGTKGIKNWANSLSASFLAKEASSSDPKLKAFWKDCYEDWMVYEQFRPKVLVASDVLESMQLRLTYFLHTKEECNLVTMKWSPFEHGIDQVSYSKLIWHFCRKQKNNSWIINAYEQEWIEYCLHYSELGYIEDLKSKGYVVVAGDETTLALEIRKEMVHYVTVLKQDRNVAAHIFSSAIRQKTTKGEWSQPKVRALLDTPVPDLAVDMHASLLRMVHDLTVHPPDIFQDLKVSFKMQLHFLRSVLENYPSFDPLHQDVHIMSQHNPPPKFPRLK